MAVAWTLWLLLAADGTPAKPAVGKPIADFTLRDAQGAPHSLADCAKDKLVVVAFLGAGCPLANRYAARLAELHQLYSPHGVAFLGIDANQQDSLADLARLVRTHKLPFPLLKDPGNAIADRFGAVRTPEVFVLDAGRVVRYRGRIDDQYGLDYSRPTPRQRDLVKALDELLTGEAVSRPVTEAVGCYIGRVQRPAPRGDVTYAKHIAPVLQKHCVQCHRTGSIAPFGLTSYADAAGWAETVREVVRDRRMPPWDADPKVGHFANDPRLTDAERKLIDTWVANGAPEGDPKDLPPPSKFAEGWRIPRADLVVTMPKPYTVPAKGVVQYQYFTVDPGFTEDKWVQAAEARAGNPAVVHHIVVMIQPPGAPAPQSRGGLGEIIAFGVPGMPALIHPPGVARLIPAGSKIVFQLHYTPNGVAQADQSRVAFTFADPKQVRKQVQSDMAINFKFRIPPGAADHELDTWYRFGQDTLVYSLFPHMHLRGKSFRIDAHYPDGKQETLLQVPRYRFEWQNQYVLSKPLRLPEGTRLHCVGHFDNSAANLANPDPAAAVRFGEQTWDEMLVGYFDWAPAEQDLARGMPKAAARADGQYDVTFRYQAPPRTKAVYLAGQFNSWKPDGHKMDGPDKDGCFTTRLTLPAGKHEYKFVLDGKTWRADPGNPYQVGDYRNSVLKLATRPRQAESGR